jgi:hypothetical protein
MEQLWLSVKKQKLVACDRRPLMLSLFSDLRARHVFSHFSPIVCSVRCPSLYWESPRHDKVALDPVRKIGTRLLHPTLPGLTWRFLPANGIGRKPNDYRKFEWPRWAAEGSTIFWRSVIVPDISDEWNS